MTAQAVFHADFWVVAGTASPVILLAAIVTAGDARVAKALIPRRERLQKRLQSRLAFISYVLSAVNIGIQGTILLASLQSLDQQRNIMPTSVAWEIEQAGLVMLFYTMIFMASLRVSEARDSKAVKDED